MQNNKQLNNTSFDTLPDELILEILKYLSIYDLFHVSSINKHYYKIYRDNLLWEFLLKKYFPKKNLTKNNFSTFKLAWKDLLGFFSISKMTICIENFKSLSGTLKNDREFILELVGLRGFLLQHVSQRLRGDKAILLAAVEKDPSAFQYADNCLKKDKTTILAALEKNELVFLHLDKAFLDDDEIVLAVVRKCGGLLGHASERLRDDIRTVLAAIQQNGGAFWSASKRLQDSELIALAAVLQDGTVIKFANERLQKNRLLALVAVLQDSSAFLLVDETLKNNKLIVQAAEQTNRNWIISSGVISQISTNSTVDQVGRVSILVLDPQFSYALNQYLQQSQEGFLSDMNSTMQYSFKKLKRKNEFGLTAVAPLLQFSFIAPRFKVSSSSTFAAKTEKIEPCFSC